MSKKHHTKRRDSGKSKRPSTAEELLALRPSRRVWAHYPSGKNLELTGKLVVIEQGDTFWPMLLTDETAIALDPRGVVIDAADGTLLYNPRTTLPREFQSGWVNEWLDRHPEWPGALFGATASEFRN